MLYLGEDLSKFCLFYLFINVLLSVFLICLHLFAVFGVWRFWLVFIYLLTISYEHDVRAIWKGVTVLRFAFLFSYLLHFCDVPENL